MTLSRKLAANRGSSRQRRTLQFESLESRQLQASDLEVGLSGFAAPPSASDLSAMTSAAMTSAASPTTASASLTDYLAVPETVSVVQYGAVGDGLTNDSEAFRSAVNSGARVVLIPYTPQGYIVEGVSVSNVELVGAGLVRLRTTAPESNGMFVLKSNVTLRGVTVDGQGSTRNRIALGSSQPIAEAGNIRIEDCLVIDAPVNSIRTGKYCNNVVLVNNVFRNSKAFNTADDWVGSGILITRNQILAIPGEGMLIDQPAVSNPTDANVVITYNTFEVAPSGHRALGLARCVNVTVSNNRFVGNADVEDLVHFEDKAEDVRIVDNSFFMRGSRKGIDAALDGDPTYSQADRVSKRILIANNLIECDGGTGLWLQGRERYEYSQIVIDKNIFFGAAVAIDARLANSQITNNTFVGGESTLRIFERGQTNLIANNGWNPDSHSSSEALAAPPLVRLLVTAELELPPLADEEEVTTPVVPPPVADPEPVVPPPDLVQPSTEPASGRQRLASYTPATEVEPPLLPPSPRPLSRRSR